MLICYKYNIEVRDTPGTGKTWMIYTNPRNGEYDDIIYTDHIEFRGVSLWTSERIDGFGFCIFSEGEISKKIHPGTGRPYILISSKDYKKDKNEKPKKLRGLKYHVPSKGLMQDNTWRIYMDIEKNISDTEYVDHVEMLNVTSFTGENALRIGFSQLSEGDVSFDYDPNTGKRFAIIHKDPYIPKYIKTESGEIVENTGENNV